MLQITQKMKPYTKDTDPPEGITRPMDPAKEIQVLLKISIEIWVCNYDSMTNLRIAKAMPIMVILENRFCRWPSWPSADDVAMSSGGL